jgi:hypothetical protein
MKGVVQKLRRIFRSIVKESAYQHNPLLVNSLTAFNFRPALKPEFPEQQPARSRAVSR